VVSGGQIGAFKGAELFRSQGATRSNTSSLNGRKPQWCSIFAKAVKKKDLGMQGLATLLAIFRMA
jgi:hypothetical protein